MIKFDTKLKLTDYLVTTSPREGKYVVLADETMQNLKSTYTYVNGELVLESGGTKVLNWRTSVANYAAVAGILTPSGMDAVVVLADETHDGQPTQYIYDGYAWVYNGVYFKESLQIEISERNVRTDDILLNKDYTLPLYYVVGSGHLEIFYDDSQLLRGADFVEVGTLANTSNIIQFKNTIPKEARLVFKRDIAGKYDETMSARKGKVDVYYFDTFTDAQNSPFLLDAGQVIRTFGHTTKNDGKGRYWILEATDKDFGYKNKANTLFINRMISADEVQIGAFIPYVAGAVAPPECVIGSGQLANRADYKRIYDLAVANNWVVTEAEWSAGKKGYFSSGDLTNTFRFPDFTDRFVRVKGSLVAVGTAIADTYRSHNHTASSASSGAHTHNTYSALDTYGSGDIVTGSDTDGTDEGIYTGKYSGATDTAGAHTHTITVNNAGSSETAPKHIAEPYYIKI